MSNKVKPIPTGYHSVTPYLIVNNAAKALEFYKKAFNATEIMRAPAPNGKIMHAEIKIGDSHIMLADEFPEMNALSPTTIGGSPVSILLYVEDVDKIFKQAIAAGAKETKPLQNQFYGDRSGMLEDPFGHKWGVSTHIEDVSSEEMDRRFKELLKQKTHA